MINDALPGDYKQAAIGGIPQDWEARSLRDGISLLSGRHVMARDVNTRGIGTPYLTGPADFPDGKIRQTKFTTRPGVLCKPGDILVTVKGSGSGTLIEADAEYCISRQLMAVRPSGWDSAFLLYSMQQNASRIRAASTGLIPGLSRSDILDQQLPIPSAAIEQREIATVLMSTDRLIVALEQLIAKKMSIKQGMMQQLLTGRTRLPGFSDQWNERRLGEIGESLIGLTYKPSSVSRSGTLVLRSSNIQNGRLDLNDDLYVDCAVPERIRIRDQDILICVRNGSRTLIGKSVMLDSRVIGQTFGAFMTVFRSDSNNFLQYYFQSDQFKRQVDEHLGATINQITNGSLSRSIVALPSPSEQNSIACRLRSMDDEIDALQVRLTKAKSVKQGMMQQLLTGRARLSAEEGAA